MKRSLFIILSIVFIFILLAIWVYVLFFGTPKNIDDVFTAFNFGDTTDPSVLIEETQPIEETPVVNVAGAERLRQLTTTPTIGYQEVQISASSTPVIYYVESGTGHIFSIDLTTGEEVRVSGTTIPASRKAVITTNGQYALIQSGNGNSSEFTIGQLNQTGSFAKTTTLNEDLVDFVATDENTFLYAVQTPTSLVVKHYYPMSDVADVLFTVPFREATIAWGEDAASTHYVYPKPTVSLEGAVFAAKGGIVSRLPIDGYGLSARGNESTVLYSKQSEGKYRTFVYNLLTKTNRQTPIKLIPEKCIFAEQSEFNFGICAAEITDYSPLTPDTWYTGEVSYADRLWELYPNVGSATQLVDTKAVSGRNIDVTNITLGKGTANVYFTNKIDQTLWMYERVVGL